MHPDDTRRLKREQDIHQATRGPDYSAVEKYIRRIRDEMSKSAAARAEHQKRKTFRWMSNGEL